jgi:hypothetical protein
MLAGLQRIEAISGIPLLVGLSRKSMLGAITGEPFRRSDWASVAAALLSLQVGKNRAGARCHQRQALDVWAAAVFHLNLLQSVFVICMAQACPTDRQTGTIRFRRGLWQLPLLARRYSNVTG